MNCWILSICPRVLNTLIFCDGDGWGLLNVAYDPCAGIPLVSPSLFGRESSIVFSDKLYPLASLHPKAKG